MQFTITVSIEDVVPEKAKLCPICEVKELTKRVKATKSEEMHTSVTCQFSCMKEECLEVATLTVVKDVLGWKP